MQNLEHVSATEWALIEQVKAGDGRAFEKLVKPLMPKLKRKVAGYFTDPYEAEDALQDALLRIYTKLHQFEGNSGLISWCYSVCATSALLHLTRKVKPRDSKGVIREMVSLEDDGGVEDGATHHNLLTSEETPESILEAKQQLQAIEATLTKMPEPMRRAILMRDIDQLDYPEIARELNCPEGTIKSRISRARSAISANMH